MTTGSLSVLNVGAGDINITFNQHNPEERDRAIRMLKDMQMRGYAILVRLDDGTYTRALEIDEARGAYIIQDPEPGFAPPEPATTEAAAEATAPAPEAPRGKRGRPRKSVPVEKAHATGVARSAGG